MTRIRVVNSADVFSPEHIEIRLRNRLCLVIFIIFRAALGKCVTVEGATALRRLFYHLEAPRGRKKTPKPSIPLESPSNTSRRDIGALLFRFNSSIFRFLLLGRHRYKLISRPNGRTVELRRRRKRRTINGGWQVAYCYRPRPR